MTPTPPEPCDSAEPAYGPVPTLGPLDLYGQNIADLDEVTITVVRLEGEWL